MIRTNRYLAEITKIVARFRSLQLVELNLNNTAEHRLQWVCNNGNRISQSLSLETRNKLLTLSVQKAATCNGWNHRLRCQRLERVISPTTPSISNTQHLKHAEATPESRDKKLEPVVYRLCRHWTQWACEVLNDAGNFKTFMHCLITH